MATAIDRARHWMDAYTDEVRFDAAIGAHHTWALVGDDGWKALRNKRIGALTDHDHEHRRFFDDGFRLREREAWTIPGEGDKPANPNRVLTEALYCTELGWRPQVEAYACGPMRDDGGYYTTHALWALVIARDNACTPAECVPDMVEELTRAQPTELKPTKTLDIDLYAERLLTTCMAECPDSADDWAHQLVRAQGADGSWGVPDSEESAYYRYHATMISAWGLAQWAASK